MKVSFCVLQTRYYIDIQNIGSLCSWNLLDTGTWDSNKILRIYVNTEKHVSPSISGKQNMNIATEKSVWDGR